MLYLIKWTLKVNMVIDYSTREVTIVPYLLTVCLFQSVILTINLIGD